MRVLTNKFLYAAIAILAMRAGVADGQIMRRRPAVTKQPNWIGGGVGIFQQFTLNDGTTSSVWSFDSGIGYTASFEHPTQSGLLVGVQGTYATPRLRYTSTGAGVTSTCLGSCDATGTITQIMALVHSSNSYSFHSVYQLTAGATGFSNFRDQTSSAKLGPAGTDYDFSFAIGYGLGFGLSSSAAIELVQEIGTVLHQKDGLATGSGNYPRMSVTRLVGKVSF